MKITSTKQKIEKIICEGHKPCSIGKPKIDQLYSLYQEGNVGQSKRIAYQLGFKEGKEAQRQEIVEKISGMVTYMSENGGDEGLSYEEGYYGCKREILSELERK